MSQDGFTYRGRDVKVVSTADIPTFYRADRHGSWAVQETLDRTDAWIRGEDPIQTVELSRMVNEVVVPTYDDDFVQWGIHKGHKARDVQPSPFVMMDVTTRTTMFTIELRGTPQSPMLVRAYPGSYMPPLPWMGSAKWADGGVEACLKFWRTHAYVYRETIVDALSDLAPNWY